MKTGTWCVAWAGTALAVAALHAGVPPLINLQGRLLDGTNLINGAVTLTVRVWNAPEAGSVLYACEDEVPVVDGFYTMRLGEHTLAGSLNDVCSAPQAWIGVSVNGTALLPRERLVSVPYALTADGVQAGGITTAMLQTGAVTAPAIAPGAVGLAGLACRTGIGTGTLVPHPQPAANDIFGTVAGWPDGGFAVAARRHDGTYTDEGRVYAFDSAGTLRATLVSPSPEAGEEFGVSVAAVGADRLLVGTTYSGPGHETGRAHLFHRNGTHLLTINRPEPGAVDWTYFGTYLSALADGRLLLGAHCYSPPGQNFAGRAYLYDTNGVRLATFVNPTPQTDDHFGQALCGLGTDRVVIGAPDDNTSFSHSGSVYLMGTDGTLLATVTNPAPGANANFGGAVAAIGSDRFAVGAALDDQAGTDAGRVYLYDRNGTLLRALAPPAPAAGDHFGASLAALGNRWLLVGATGRDAGAIDAGTAYLFDYDGTHLATLTNPAPVALDGFGQALAGAGDARLLAGVPGSDIGASDAGVAYRFAFTGYVPGLEAESVRSIPPGALADGAVTMPKLADSAVTAAKLAAGAVAATHVDAGTFATTFWKANGNAGTTTGTHFLGTTDEQPLDLRANNARILRLAPGNGAPNIIGGHPNNAVAAGVRGATIAGGGGWTAAMTNGIASDLASIGGGYGNSVLKYADGAAIGGGANNRAEGQVACVPGGAGNRAVSYSLAAGTTAHALHPGSFVWADETGVPFATTAYGQFLVRARGGVGIGTNLTPQALTVAGGGIFRDTVQAQAFVGGGAGLTGLSGGAITAASITTAQLAAGAVGAAQLAASAVGESKLAADAVTTGKIADGAVGSTDLATGAVTATRLADGAVAEAKLAANAVTGAKIADGTITAGDLSGSGFGTTFWLAGGNGGTTPGTHYLGTSDNQALELKVNGQRVLRLGPHATSPILLGGHAANGANSAAYGSVVGGGGHAGEPHSVDAVYGAVAGGANNHIGASSGWATVSGGRGNRVETNSNYAAVGGGNNNSVGPFAPWAHIGGGGANSVADASFAAICGGQANTIAGGATEAFVGAGYGNHVADGASRAVIGGGDQNTVSATHAVVAGGSLNSASGAAAAVGGGEDNLAAGACSTVAGGYDCHASGAYSFAGGRHARAAHDGSFVWADNQAATCTSDRENHFKVRCYGGAKFVTADTWSGDIGVYILGGGSAWSSMSDRRVKENVEPVDTEAIVDTLDTVPVTCWNLVSQDPAIRHIGPMAQDLYAAFGLGETNTMINTSDGIGLALAAAQGLSLRVKDLAAELEAERGRARALEARLAVLEAWAANRGSTP